MRNAALLQLTDPTTGQPWEPITVDVYRLHVRPFADGGHLVLRRDYPSRHDAHLAARRLRRKLVGVTSRAEHNLIVAQWYTKTDKRRTLRQKGEAP